MMKAWQKENFLSDTEWRRITNDIFVTDPCKESRHDKTKIEKILFIGMGNFQEKDQNYTWLIAINRIFFTQICTVTGNCKWLLKTQKIVCTFLYCLKEFIRCTAIKRKEKLRFILEAKWNKPQKNLRSKIEDYCFIHFSLVSLSRDVYCLWYELFLFARARESSRKVGARSDPSPTSLRFSERINFAMLAISKNLRQIRGSPRTTRWNYLFILSV